MRKVSVEMTGTFLLNIHNQKNNQAALLARENY